MTHKASGPVPGVPKWVFHRHQRHSVTPLPCNELRRHFLTACVTVCVTAADHRVPVASCEPLFRMTVKGGTIGRGNARGEGAGAGRTKVGFSSSSSSSSSPPYEATTYVGTFLTCQRHGQRHGRRSSRSGRLMRHSCCQGPGARSDACQAGEPDLLPRRANSLGSCPEHLNPQRAGRQVRLSRHQAATCRLDHRPG